MFYLTLTAISPSPTFHLARFMASSFSKPTLLLDFFENYLKDFKHIIISISLLTVDLLLESIVTCLVE